MAQASGAFWHDLSLKAEKAAAADGPAFLNVLSDCPLAGVTRLSRASDRATCRRKPVSGRCTRSSTAAYRLTHDVQRPAADRRVAASPDSLPARLPARERIARRGDSAAGGRRLGEPGRADGLASVADRSAGVGGASPPSAAPLPSDRGESTHEHSACDGHPRRILRRSGTRAPREDGRAPLSRYGFSTGSTSIARRTRAPTSGAARGRRRSGS